MSGLFRTPPASRDRARRSLLRGVAGATAAAVSWLVASPAIAAVTVQPPRPEGRVRSLTAAEMHRIVGAQFSDAGIGGVGGTDLVANNSLAAVSDSSGAPDAWEGQVGGMSTRTGNKLTSHPLVSWTQRGGRGVSLSLHHSSMGESNNVVGKRWTHSFNAYLVLPSGTTGGGEDPGGTGDGGGTGGDDPSAAPATGAGSRPSAPAASGG